MVCAESPPETRLMPTPRLELPMILPAQAQKHVTHNEALAALDLVVQAVLEAVGAGAPPATPAEGAAWALDAAASGAWAGRGAGDIAQWRGGAWVFAVPAEGWRAWDRGAGVLRVFVGGAWRDVAATLDLENLEGLGVGTASDPVNRLSVAADATLLTHAGGGHQLKLNKAAAADTVSLLYQSDFSGRAEIGLTGSNDLAVKVSPDGAAWTTALSIARATGAASLAAGLSVGGQPAYHRGNVLGPVALGAGLPTGALIERGANAGGDFIRFADGTQICKKTLTLEPVTAAQGAGFRSAAATTWSFPSGFLAGTIPAIAASDTNLGGIWVSAYCASGSAAALRAMSFTAVPAAPVVVATAIGRWA